MRRWVVLMTRKMSLFLIAVGVWTWVIWPRFAVAIVDDARAFDHGTPTAFLWVHAALILGSLAIGTAVGVLGVKGWRALRGTVRPAEGLPVATAGAPKD